MIGHKTMTKYSPCIALRSLIAVTFLLQAANAFAGDDITNISQFQVEFDRLTNASKLQNTFPTQIANYLFQEDSTNVIVYKTVYTEQPLNGECKPKQAPANIQPELVDQWEENFETYCEVAFDEYGLPLTDTDGNRIYKYKENVNVPIIVLQPDGTRTIEPEILLRANELTALIASAEQLTGKVEASEQEQFQANVRALRQEKGLQMLLAAVLSTNKSEQCRRIVTADNLRQALNFEFNLPKDVSTYTEQMESQYNRVISFQENMYNGKPIINFKAAMEQRIFCKLTEVTTGGDQRQLIDETVGNLVSDALSQFVGTQKDLLSDFQLRLTSILAEIETVITDIVGFLQLRTKVTELTERMMLIVKDKMHVFQSGSDDPESGNHLQRLLDFDLNSFQNEASSFSYLPQSYQETFDKQETLYDRMTDHIEDILIIDLMIQSFRNNGVATTNHSSDCDTLNRVIKSDTFKNTFESVVSKPLSAPIENNDTDTNDTESISQKNFKQKIGSAYKSCLNSLQSFIGNDEDEVTANDLEYLKVFESELYNLSKAQTTLILSGGK